MLRACRQLLKPGGRTAFHTIHTPPGLDAPARRRAARDGPDAVATTRPYADLLGAAGLVDITSEDCTAEFEATTRAWIEWSDAHREALSVDLGPEVFDDRQAGRRAQLRAIHDGLLRRSLFVATRPPR